MPTYEYACKSCGKHLEVHQSFTDDALTTCPSCEGPLRKVFANIGIAFKGSGFYSTDNRGKNGGPGTGVEGSWGSEKKSSGDGKDGDKSGSSGEGKDGGKSGSSGSSGSTGSGSGSGSSGGSGSPSSAGSGSSGSGSSGSKSSGSKSAEKAKAAAS